MSRSRAEVYRSMTSDDVVNDRRSIMKKISRIKKMRGSNKESSEAVREEDDMYSSSAAYTSHNHNHNQHASDEYEDPNETYDCLEQSLRYHRSSRSISQPLESDDYDRNYQSHSRKYNNPHETIYPTIEPSKKRLISIMYMLIVIAVIVTFVLFLEATKLSPYAISEAGTSSLDKNHNADPSTPLAKNDYKDGFNKHTTHNDNDNSSGKRERAPARPETKEEQHSERVVAFRSILGPSVSPLDKLDNMGTPQHRALHWLANADKRKVALPTNGIETQKLIQRYVLALIYFSTHGDYWKQQLNFLSINDECEWNQIFDGGYFAGAGVCDDSLGDGHGFVTTLALWDNNLHGTIPDEIGSLHKLKVLSLSNNHLYGELPPHMNFLNDLERVFLQKNKITGVLSFICDNPNVIKFHSDCLDPSVKCKCCEICCNTEKNECHKHQQHN